MRQEAGRQLYYLRLQYRGKTVFSPRTYRNTNVINREQEQHRAEPQRYLTHGTEIQIMVPMMVPIKGNERKWGAILRGLVCLVCLVCARQATGGVVGVASEAEAKVD